MRRSFSRAARSVGELLVDNPATGEVLRRLPMTELSEALEMVDKAQDEFLSWRQKSALERANVLSAIHDRLMEPETTEEFAQLISSESGKVINEARGEVAYTASYFRWFGEEARRLYGERIPPWNPQRRATTSFSPVGLCLLIAPWNFPGAMLGRKLAPALAAGCVGLLKPAPETPLTALRMAEVVLESGGPFVGVLVGDREHSKALVEAAMRRQEVRKISFTGSTGAGQALAGAAAACGMRSSMELGGRAPVVVCRDASDLGAVAAEILAAKFRNAGQTCVAANHVLVHASRRQELLHHLQLQVGDLCVGPATIPHAEIGPVITDRAAEQLQQVVARTVQQGAAVVVGGQGRVDVAQVQDGRRVRDLQVGAGKVGKSRFVVPTVFDLGPASKASAFACMEGELFGPVLPVLSFEEDAEALRFANESEAGLAAYVFSENVDRARFFSEGIEAGMVAVNCGIFSTAEIPFGGVKASGMGREGGSSGIKEYVEEKVVVEAVK